jgi:protein-tyrosine phosphatase
MTRLGAMKKIAKRITLGFVGFLVLGNLAIVGVHLWAHTTAEAETRVAAPNGIQNFQAVDDKVWRGGHPTKSGYEELVARGVETIVDLRAETGLKLPTELLERKGVDLVRIPIRDGQVPKETQVERFLRTVRRTDGRVYVHCMAGVGRTGTMVGAYLVEVKDEAAISALRKNLSVGPPSLEQIAYVAGEMDEPNPIVTGVSRVLDGPRRIWSYFH